MRRSLSLACLVLLVTSTTSLAQPATPLPASGPAAAASGPSAPALTVDEQRAFLAAADVLKWKETSKGVTRPKKVTLSDGTRTHDAAFQAVDVRKARAELPKGVEVNFRDYYGYNIAAHHLACLINRCDLVPAAVERVWRGEHGSMVWWVDGVMMDEGERIKSNQSPPSPVQWVHQQHLARLFTELTGDSDRNQTNLLITKDWRMVLIDFSRAFRLHKQPKSALSTVQTIDADVLEGLQALTKEKIKEVAGRWLGSHEIDAVLARRDGILAHIDRLVATKGRAVVVLEPARAVSAQ